MIEFVRTAGMKFYNSLRTKRSLTGTGMMIMLLVLGLEFTTFLIFLVSSNVLAYALAAPSFAIVVLLLRKLRFHWSTVTLFLAILGFYAVHVSYTNFNERNLTHRLRLSISSTSLIRRTFLQTTIALFVTILRSIMDWRLGHIQ